MTSVSNLTSISLAWSNLNKDSVFSNHGIEWAVSDEGGVARFNLSACLEAEGFNCCTHFLHEGLGVFQFADNSSWQVNRNDFRGC